MKSYIIFTRIIVNHTLCLIYFPMFYTLSISLFVFTRSLSLSFSLSLSLSHTHSHTLPPSLSLSLLHLCTHTAPTTSTSTTTSALGYSTSRHSRRSIEDDGYLNSNAGSRIRDKNSVLSFFLNRFKDTQPGTLILVRHGAYVHANVHVFVALISPYCLFLLFFLIPSSPILLTHYLTLPLSNLIFLHFYIFISLYL